MLAALPQRVVSPVLSHTGDLRFAPIGPPPTAGSLPCCDCCPWACPFHARATRKSLKDAPNSPFWELYSSEMIARLSKADSSAVIRWPPILTRLQPYTDDLKDQPTHSDPEGDNDPLTTPWRAAPKALHPQARVHTFHGRAIWRQLRN
jgi:hypothetical protein